MNLQDKGMRPWFYCYVGNNKDVTKASWVQLSSHVLSLVWCTRMIVCCEAIYCYRPGIGERRLYAFEHLLEKKEDNSV